jgi:hypothetical protein
LSFLEKSGTAVSISHFPEQSHRPMFIKRLLTEASERVGRPVAKTFMVDRWPDRSVDMKAEIAVAVAGVLGFHAGSLLPNIEAEALKTASTTSFKWQESSKCKSEL